VLAYLGSLGSWYMLDEMLDFFRAFLSRSQQGHFLIVTHDDPAPIEEAAVARGVHADRLTIRAASREEVPELMGAADLGIFFIRPVFSKTASSPTKMGEMLAIGLPIITNAGVGDVEAMVDELRCGVAVHEFTPAAYDRALRELETLLGRSAQRRERARPRFDVEIGIERYASVYASLRDGTNVVTKRLPSEGGDP